MLSRSAIARGASAARQSSTAGEPVTVAIVKSAPLVSLARRALDIMLPPRALDDRAAVLSPGLGPHAWARVRFIEAPVCDGCGGPLPYDQGEGVSCPGCPGERGAIAKVRAACAYDDRSRELILQLKHADRTDLAPLFARWLARAAADLTAEIDAVLPTPMHPRRLLARRYNQAAEIARPLARMIQRPYLADALIRARATGSQEGRSAEGRRRNVAGAFKVPSARAGVLAGLRLLLVDDVVTTGATASACARALLRAGAARVCLAAVARVERAGGGAI